MTLRTQITADVSGVFLGTSDFAHSIRHRPLNVAASDATVAAVVDLDVESDPAFPYSDQGERYDRFARLELATSVAVHCQGENRDAFLLSLDSAGALVDYGTSGSTQELWRAVKVIARDHAMQTVLIHTVAKAISKRAALRE